MDFGFLLYDSRSGSTLLSALINQYEGVHVSKEIKYVTQILDWPKEIRSDQDLNELLDHLFSFVQMKEAGFDLTKIKKKLSAPVDKRSLIEFLVRYQFRGHEGEFWLIKHAPMRYLNKLTELFPQVKYVHILRDVRGVHASKKKTIGTRGKPMSTNVIKSGRYWKQKLDNMSDCNAPIHHLRYEDLLDSQESTLLNVLGFFGITEPKKTGDVSDYSKTIGNSQASLHQNLNKGVIKGRAESWRTELTPNEIRAIERDCEQYLDRWNYPITSSRGTATYPIFILNELLVFVAEVFSNAIRSLLKGNFRTRLNYFFGKGTPT